MKYSDIVGDGFHKIYLPYEQIKVLDQHFLAAAHHRAQFIQTKSTYHKDLFILHLTGLRKLVASGGFKEALDPSGAGLDRPDAWLSSPLPDPKMFDNFPFPDKRYGPGKSHPNDGLLLKKDLDRLAS